MLVGHIFALKPISTTILLLSLVFAHLLELVLARKWIPVSQIRCEKDRNTSQPENKVPTDGILSVSEL